VKRILLLLIIVLCFSSAVFGIQIKEALWNGDSIEYVDGFISLKKTDNATDDEVDSVFDEYDVEILQDFDKHDIAWAEIDTGSDYFEIIDSLESSELFTFVNPDLVYHLCMEPNDSRFDEQWHLLDTLNDCDIDAPEAWEITTGDTGITMYILDTGLPSGPPSDSFPDDYVTVIRAMGEIIPEGGLIHPDVE